ncbi:uncharacterized protein UTRI_00914 [Ustilago trichophora]|uniref:Uncharacterized protein n=1 Tax=Ustilago trichophora TaxID=86804 RepID=A0A5C3DVM4_9BASI|nr:uncharacterized protein UTRI_00914 [Ustilago trichophora]
MARRESCLTGVVGVAVKQPFELDFVDFQARVPGCLSQIRIGLLQISNHQPSVAKIAFWTHTLSLSRTSYNLYYWYDWYATLNDSGLPAFAEGNSSYRYFKCHLDT